MRALQENSAPVAVTTETLETGNPGRESQHDHDSTAAVGRPCIHPFADFFPSMGDEEIAELGSNIQQFGLEKPIVVHQDGRLVDGRQRLRACVIAGIAPTFTTKTFANDLEVAQYVYAANLLRAHYTQVQKAFIAAKIQQTLREQAAANQKAGMHLPAKVAGGDTRTIAASLAGGVASRYVDTARKAAAIDPKIGELVARGLISRMQDIERLTKLDPKDRNVVLHVVEHGRMIDGKPVQIEAGHAMSHLKNFGKTSEFRVIKAKCGSKAEECSMDATVNGIIATLLHCACSRCAYGRQSMLGQPVVNWDFRDDQIVISISFDPTAAFETEAA